MKKAELVFVPIPLAGHIVSAVEMAKLLVDHDERLSVSLLIMKHPSDSNIVCFTESIAASTSSDRIRFINLPHDESDKSDRNSFFTTFLENKKPHVKEAVSKLVLTESSGPADSPKLAGFVMDMICMCMIDVADEFGVPSYVFFTSGAAFLGLMLHAQALHDEQNKPTTELKDSDELEVPSFVNPVPAGLLPDVFHDKVRAGFVHAIARKYRRVKGILVNTFAELEYHAVSSFDDQKTPTVYPVGPIFNVKGENYDLGPGEPKKKTEILTWLDDQPPSSVVFLCFGSKGGFRQEQVKEIACALEQSGHRFLWSLRQSSPKDKVEPSTEYTNLADVLPEGFLDRTSEFGKVIGWAPQVAILGHPSIGGFVSHCGWNSILESLWFGVPIATWAMYAEQRLNAFQLVKELGLAVEIKINYRKDVENPTIVTAEEIEIGIKCLMEHDSEIKKRVKEMSEKSRKALMDGGSSFSSLGQLINDVCDNIP